METRAPSTKPPDTLGPAAPSEAQPWPPRALGGGSPGPPERKGVRAGVLQTPTGPSRLHGTGWPPGPHRALPAMPTARAQPPVLLGLRPGAEQHGRLSRRGSWGGRAPEQRVGERHRSQHAEGSEGGHPTCLPTGLTLARGHPGTTPWRTDGNKLALVKAQRLADSCWLPRPRTPKFPDPLRVHGTGPTPV